MTDENPVFRWYVLHIRSKFEDIVTQKLDKKSFETFNPKIRVRSRRKDRKVVIRVPMFPGYIFVQANLKPAEHIDILKTVGAVKLIGNKSGPLSVADEIIDSLKIVETSEKKIHTGKRFKKGHRIIVINGPFAGVSGVFVRYRGKGRVVVYIGVLGQYAAVEVEEADVEILPEIAS